MLRRRLGRLPKKVSLGRGYTVGVILVTRTQMQEITDDEEKDMTAACWDTDTMTIYVDNSLSRSKMWEAYFHELYHAVHDVAEKNRETF